MQAQLSSWLGGKTRVEVMKSLRVSTAITLMLMSAAAPAALSVGDPNTDTGVGSASSRGPFGFSSNNDVIYETPVNTYGVYRDAHGGLRDRGMIPDNLVTPAPEPTWEEANANRAPMPGGGAPGGLGGFGGALGGIGGGLPGFGVGLGAGGLGIGGIGGSIGGIPGNGIGGIGAGVGQFPVGVGLSPMRFNGATNASVGVGGAGPTAQVPRTPFGFSNTPGTFFRGWPAPQQRFMGPSSGFIPFNRGTAMNRTFLSGGNTISEDTIIHNTSAGPARELRRLVTDANGRTTVTSSFTYNGNSWTQSSVYNGNSGTGPDNIAANGDPITFQVQNADGTTQTVQAVRPRNFSTSWNQSSNNAFTSPSTPNTPWTVADNTDSANGTPGSFGAGFATPQTSGHHRSALFADNQATGNFGGGFATPTTSGDPSGVYFQSSLNASGALGASTATPQSAGHPRSAIYSNPNNRFGPGGFGGLGGLGGISAGTGNQANRGGGFSSSAAGVSGEVLDANDKSNGAIARAGRRNNTGSINAQFEVEGMNAIDDGSAAAVNTGARLSTMRGRAATSAAAINTGARLSGPFTTGDQIAGFTGGGAVTTGGSTLQRVIPNSSQAGAGSAAALTPPLTATGAYAMSRVNDVRNMVQNGFVSGESSSHNIHTTREVDLQKLNLTPSQAIGRVIGSMRFENGDIVTYGSKGTLRLAHDNSGSITLNSGEVYTFRKATPEMRWVALRSALIL